MTMPIPPRAFANARAADDATLVEGLSAVIDQVAARAAPSHHFLRYGWFAAAVAAYGGHPRTLIVTRAGAPAMALPIVAVGPEWLGLSAVLGSYWPFRSFALAQDADDGVLDAALALLARNITALRIGPVYDDDAAAAPLIAAARARGWAVLDRFVAESFLLDIAAARADGAWPRTSTLKKNRYHEKHLAEHGALDWRFVGGAGWTAQAFDDLAAIERKSWLAERTDGRDAKFTADGHGAFWRAAAADPTIAGMMRAAVLDVGGAPAAFSFDLDAGDLKYAIANSYDPTYARYSPGKLLYYRNLTDGIDRGIARVDWGAGDSGYKRVIGAVAGPAIRDWVIVRPGAPAFAARALAGLWRGSGQRVAR